MTNGSLPAASTGSIRDTETGFDRMVTGSRPGRNGLMISAAERDGAISCPTPAGIAPNRRWTACRPTRHSLCEYARASQCVATHRADIGSSGQIWFVW